MLSCVSLCKTHERNSVSLCNVVYNYVCYILSKTIFFMHINVCEKTLLLLICITKRKLQFVMPVTFLMFVITIMTYCGP